ncbi:MAG TPA: carbon-nitrogen hydrolase family protein [Tepidisphaeraceae bacterium]|jgi:predicted amidohydrolase|nr:carbon-nitrogen hydrolase family protein [Tepidisphaeraceae bacterium]
MLHPIRCVIRVVLILSAGIVSPTLFATEPTTQPMSVKVAAIQCSSDLGAIQANRKKLTALIEQAADHDAKIVVLPEAAVTGYLSQDLMTNWRVPGKPIEPIFVGKDPAGFAETVPGPSTDYFCALAKRLHIYLTIPLVEVVKPSDVAMQNEARYFNTDCLAAPDGRLVAHYRKLTPWPYPEKSWASPGDLGVQTCDTEYGRVGLAICYDIHTILPKYQPRRIWALLYSIAWVDDNHPAEWFWHVLPGRIAPFDHYIVGANWSVDDQQSWFGYGFSTIYAPGGAIVATSHSLHGSDIIYADLKTAWAEKSPDAHSK